MENNDKYITLKKLLMEGICDTYELGLKMGSTAKNKKSVKEHANKVLRKHEDLKSMHASLLNSVPTETKNEVEYKDNTVLPPMGIETVEQLKEVTGDNVALQVLCNEIMKLKESNNNDNNITNVFELDVKYNSFDDAVVPLSLRVSYSAKKKLEAFCKKHSGLKKVYVCSQMIEEFVDRYK